MRVFENGNLVDDTAIALPPTQREELRADAFHRADERRRADAVKRLERAARREAMRRAEQQRIAEARRRPEPVPEVVSPSRRSRKHRASHPASPARRQSLTVRSATMQWLS